MCFLFLWAFLLGFESAGRCCLVWNGSFNKIGYTSLRGMRIRICFLLGLISKASKECPSLYESIPYATWTYANGYRYYSELSSSLGIASKPIRQDNTLHSHRKNQLIYARPSSSSWALSRKALASVLLQIILTEDETRRYGTYHSGEGSFPRHNVKRTSIS